MTPESISSPSSEWPQLAAELVGSIGEESFWQALAGFVRSAVDAEPPVIYIFRGAHRPQLVWHSIKPKDMQVQVQRYLNGPYLLDPFYTRYLEGGKSGLYSLAEIAPDHFKQSRYFEEFYRYTNLIDEACFICACDDRDVSAQVSVARFDDKRPFTEAEFTRLRHIAALVQAAVAKHWSQSAYKQAESDSAHRAFECFGKPLLTERERQIVTMILRGHSSKSAANALGISPETVRNHRKRIYSKLGVASQSKLFSLFIEQAFPGDLKPRAVPLAFLRRRTR